MIPQDSQALFRVAQWILENKRRVVKKVREVAGTEENYLIIIREIDRVESQLRRARTMHAEATLTLMDWLNTLEYFHWQCAYCESRSFQVMSHVIQLPMGGTTPDNCVPGCYGCRASKKKGENKRVQAYLSSLQCRSGKAEMVDTLPSSPPHR